MKINKTVLPWLLLTAVFFVGLVPVYGSELDELRAKQKDTQKQIDQYKSVISERKQEIKTL
ncbi:MAG: hypothetical protein ACYCX4_07865, partial [Bacillota bacterium]